MNSCGNFVRNPAERPVGNRGADDGNPPNAPALLRTCCDGIYYRSVEVATTMETKKLNRMAIVVCDCKNEYQDSVYGKQHRVGNPVNRLQKDGVYAVRCTVCGKVHNLGSLGNARYF